jgi:hypothetical protein
MSLNRFLRNGWRDWMPASKEVEAMLNSRNRSNIISLDSVSPICGREIITEHPVPAGYDFVNLHDQIPQFTSQPWVRSSAQFNSVSIAFEHKKWSSAVARPIEETPLLAFISSRSSIFETLRNLLFNNYFAFWSDIHSQLSPCTL